MGSVKTKVPTTVSNNFVDQHSFISVFETIIKCSAMSDITNNSCANNCVISSFSSQLQKSRNIVVLIQFACRFSGPKRRPNQLYVLLWRMSLLRCTRVCPMFCSFRTFAKFSNSKILKSTILFDIFLVSYQKFSRNARRIELI